MKELSARCVYVKERKCRKLIFVVGKVKEYITVKVTLYVYMVRVVGKVYIQQFIGDVANFPD